MDALEVRPGLTLRPAWLTWTAVRGQGPGGQNVNKVASKVELRFDLPACDVLDSGTVQRLRAIPGLLWDADGRLVVVSQRTRDQRQNLDDTREKLRSLVNRALIRPEPRIDTRPTRGSVRRRLTDKRVRGQTKQGRRTDPGRDDR